jgi:excisionase family DNA binding protein
MATNPMYSEQEKPFDRMVEQGSTADQRQAAMLGKYPLLEAVLSAKGLRLKGVWTIADVAEIFGVHSRAIYEWIASGKLAARDLPGRGRFLSEDLEEFLRNSKRVPNRRNGRGRQQ